MAKTHFSDLVGLLSEIEPIASLSSEVAQKLASHCSLEILDEGMTLFKEGEPNEESVYLISGSLNLISKDPKNGEPRKLKSGTQEAKYPINDKCFHEVSAIAETRCEIIRINMDLLDKIIAEDQLAVCRIETQAAFEQNAAKTEKEGFLKKILNKFTGGMRASKEKIDAFSLIGRFRPPLFKSISDEDMKELCDRMEAVSVKSGITVIRQDEEGDYYYIIVNGSVAVTRGMEDGGEPVFLAELNAGETFGEEALLSNAKRNATITMKNKGTLLRLAKRDFIELLKEPMLKWLSPVEAGEIIKHGAKWLDVRPSAEFQRSHLGGAISMPLHELRDRISELNKTTMYICCCATGRLSCSAAFLLGQRGYQAGVLRGGIQRLT